VILKIVPKAGNECTLEKVHQLEQKKEKSGQKFDAAFGTIFRISKCFQRGKQKLHSNFSLELGRLKI
jgi:hypothetical protein